MLRNSTLALTLALLAGCAGQQVPRSDVEDDFAPPPEPAVVAKTVAPAQAVVALEHAIGLLRDGQYAQADADLEEIVRVRPDLAEAHLNLGLARLHRRKYVEAIRHLEEGIGLRPDEHRAYNLIGIAYRELGRFGDAEAAYLKAIAKAPDHDRAQLNLGVLYDLYLDKPEQALVHYRNYQALQKAPDSKVAGWIVLLERAEVRKGQASNDPGAGRKGNPVAGQIEGGDKK